MRLIQLAFREDILGMFGSPLPSCMFLFLPPVFGILWEFNMIMLAFFPLGLDIPLVVSFSLDFPKT